jgi:hypothetical protein
MIEDAFMKESYPQLLVAEELDKEAIKGMQDYGIKIIIISLTKK